MRTLPGPEEMDNLIHPDARARRTEMDQLLWMMENGQRKMERMLKVDFTPPRLPPPSLPTPKSEKINWEKVSRIMKQLDSKPITCKTSPQWPLIELSEDMLKVSVDDVLKRLRLGRR